MGSGCRSFECLVFSVECLVLVAKLWLSNAVPEALASRVNQLSLITLLIFINNHYYSISNDKLIPSQ